MRRCLAALLFAALATAPLGADPPPSASPVPFEATVFKDGHCLFRARATAKHAAGSIELVGLPPVTMGSLWIESETAGVHVVAIRAATREQEKRAPCLDLVSLARANAGRKTRLSEQAGTAVVEHVGTLLAMGASLDNAPAMIGLRTATGARYVAANRLVGLEIEGEVATDVATKATDTRWIVDLTAAPGGALPAEVTLVATGLVRGVRWIPEYRLERAGDAVRLRLQATVINDVLDLAGVALRLVAGVPKFPLADSDSALWIAGDRPALSSHFAHFTASPGDLRMSRQQQRMLSQQLSNAFQSNDSTESAGGGGRPVDPAQLHDAATAQVGDLHLYEKTGVTLAKGERASYLMADATLACKDVYRWTLLAVPPQPLWHHVGEEEAARLHRDIEAARVEHRLAIANSSGIALSTGPAMLFVDGRVLGQNILRYAAPGGTVELPVTDAIDIANSREERETLRDHNVRLREPDVNYTRVSLEGELRLVNRKTTAVTVRIVRHVFGDATHAGEGGKITKANLLEHAADTGLGARYQLSWPWWWAGVNPVSTLEWTVELAAGEEKKIPYRWHYHFR